MEKIGRFGIGDAIIVFLMAGCVTLCLYLTFQPKINTVTTPEYDESRWGSHDAWLHFVECQALCDNYQVDLKMWSWATKTIKVHIPDGHWFSTGTDGACQAFGIFAEKILDIYADGWLLYVTGNFVPSSKMPIDLEWAKQLSEGY